MKPQNVSYLRVVAIFAGAASLIVLTPSARAHDEKKGASHEESSGAMPKTSAAALEKAHALHMELGGLVKTKNLKAVHDTTEKLMETTNMLPGLSKALPADKLKRVEGAVKNLEKALDALYDAADGGSQAGAEKNLAVVDSLMKLLSSQYSAGSK